MCPSEHAMIAEANDPECTIQPSLSDAKKNHEYDLRYNFAPRSPSSQSDVLSTKDGIKKTFFPNGNIESGIYYENEKKWSIQDLVRQWTTTHYCDIWKFRNHSLVAMPLRFTEMGIRIMK